MNTNKIKKLLLTALCFTLMLGAADVFSLQADASASSDAKAAYRKKLNHYDTTYKYKIIDIDKNGIPELLVANYFDPAVFTYNKKTGKVKRLASGFSFDRIYYNTKKHMVVVVNHGSGWTWYKFYKVSGLKAKKKDVYKYDKIYNVIAKKY